ncbi:organic cation transporter-like protein [Drosophila rhopaloa]|uniref:Major facilitator superfamily (MFS) profile domain-containing protein n=1 Tax=Drosophila rhopaloa TaxID=1041015 RepID=A0ABM5HK17_DRORH|nr:organic cation transporter-like protein [Drosophila rhopaloa]
MGYDEAIVHLGEFGRYQKIIYFLICLTSIPVAFHKMAGVFLLAKPDFRCALPFENGSSYELPPHLWNLSYPQGVSGVCAYYDVEYSEEYLNGSLPRTTNETKSCSSYVYDRSKYLNSALTEWDLVCGRAFMTSISENVFMFGVFLGSIVFGQLSDKYGRKPILFASLVIQVLFGVVAGVAPEYFTYTLARLMVGATTSGVFLVAYVIAMEMVGPDKRLYAGIFVMMFFSVGYMLSTLFAYLVHDWRNLQIALTLPGLIFLSYYWIIPESVRWLLSKGRKDCAIANMQRAARFNKLEISNETLSDLLDEGEAAVEKAKQKLEDPDRDEGPPPSVWDLFCYPNLRRKTLLIFFDWLVTSGVYYGISWNTSTLGGNELLNFVISGAVEIPAYIFLLLTLDRWGRRSILCGSLVLAGLSLLATGIIPVSMHSLIVACAMLGKLAITASYGTVYLFSAEQFPTVVRAVGMGAASMVARISGMAVPYLKDLAVIWAPLPLLICGSFSLTAGLLTLLLPETHNKPMLETIADGESFGKKTKGDVYLETGHQQLQTPESQPLKGLVDTKGIKSNGHKF